MHILKKTFEAILSTWGGIETIASMLAYSLKISEKWDIQYAHLQIFDKVLNPVLRDVELPVFKQPTILPFSSQLAEWEEQLVVESKEVFKDLNALLTYCIRIESSKVNESS